MRPPAYSNILVYALLAAGPSRIASTSMPVVRNAEPDVDGGVQRHRGQAVPRRDHGLGGRRDGDGRRDLLDVLRPGRVPHGNAANEPEDGRELRGARTEARAADEGEERAFVV